jgi:hypothetical protein
MNEIFFIKDIVEQFGPIVATDQVLRTVVAWNGDDVFYMFRTHTYDGEYLMDYERMSDEINATSSVGEVVEYATKWLEDEVE